MKHASRSAFTLIETVISLSIMSVLFLGLSGAVMIGSRAIPSATDTGQNDLVTIDSLNQLRFDLRMASTVDYKSTAFGKQLTLAIVDYNAPGQPTTIRYRYYADTEVLTRQTNEIAEQTLIEGITNFVVSGTQDDSKLTVAKFTIVKPNTIQKAFQMHVTLPHKPEYI